MSDFERFQSHELTELRTELQQGGLDTFQVGQLLTSFLVQRGYGVSADEARVAATRIEAVGCTLPCLQEELEKIAFVM